MLLSNRPQRVWLISALVLVLIMLAVLALSLGAVPIPITEVIHWVNGHANQTHTLILTQLRLPRVLLAMLVGAVLATCGGLSQGLFRNPLADPSLIGVSAGASLGASIAIVLLQPIGFQWVGLSLVSICAFVGAVLSVSLVYQFARSSLGTSVSTLLLAGVGLAFIAGSVSTLLEALADHAMLRQLSLWRMGGLEGANGIKVWIMALVASGVILVGLLQARALDALLLGESEAHHLGLPVAKLKRGLILTIAAGVGVSVAFAGVIAFVGLMVPHIARAWIGPVHRNLLPLCALLGAILVLLADTVARTVYAPVELPVGMLISLIGAPFFLLMLRKRYRFYGQ